MGMRAGAGCSVLFIIVSNILFALRKSICIDVPDYEVMYGSCQNRSSAIDQRHSSSRIIYCTREIKRGMPD
jgi:hypothetical protein